MQIERYFSDQLSKINWVKRDVKLTGTDGSIIFELKDVEAPDFWSDNAVTIVANKYLKKINGVQETSVKQLVKRVVDKIVEWGAKGNYFSDGEYTGVFRDELTAILLFQYAAFNTPVWINFGLPNRPQTGAACFLLDVEDSMDSIRDWLSLESKIFQAGAGAGVNPSKLRTENAPLSMGGRASGPLSFMKAADAQAGVIKSGGFSRESAKMVVMNVDHPDIEKFIECKSLEEKKARVLIEAGYSGGMDGEALTTVSHQNANYSVRVTDDFMNKYLDGDKYAANIINKIAENAWACGDPGLVYADTILKTYTLPNSGLPVTLNPCAEITSQPVYSACTLASLNIAKFGNHSKYDWRTFDYVVTIMTIALDIICINSDYPDERIAANSRAQHHIGLGYTNIGSYLMLSGLAYDSNEGRKAVAEISAQLTGQSFLTSALLAEEIGAFPDYEKNKEGMQRVIQEFCNRAQNLKNSRITATWASVKEWGSKYGYRNANTTAIAPTGTIAFLMDADTTGIEPELALIKYKNLAGGGTLKLVNPLVKQALQNLGYDFSTIKAIESHIKDNNSVIGSALKPEHAPIFSTSFGENSLDPMSHVKMVAAAQQFITEGISKTANVPESATVEDIKNIYVEAWKMELKAISIYRDNSKATQPLSITKKPKSNVVALPYKTVRHPLPNERPSITHKIDIANFEGYITCGLYEDGAPGEIFITANKQGSTVSGMLDSIAILISIALQHNVPLYTITNKLINTRFEPSGFTKNPDIPVATSVVDYVCKWLNLKFGEEGKILTHANGKGQVGPDPAFNKVGQKFYDAPLTAVMKAKVFTGDTCTTCGSLLVKSGTCFTCESCGSTSGGCA